MMKHLTFALAAVTLPLFSSAYKCVPIAVKQYKVYNENLEVSGRPKVFGHLNIPEGTIRVVYQISVSDSTWPSRVDLFEQARDLIAGSAPDYIVPYMISKNEDTGKISVTVFDRYGCVIDYYRDDYYQCIPRQSYKQVKGGTFDMPWSPTDRGQLFICLKNNGTPPVCYVRIEAVAILK